MVDSHPQMAQPITWWQEKMTLKSEIKRLESKLDEKIEKFQVEMMEDSKRMLENYLEKPIDAEATGKSNMAPKMNFVNLDVLTIVVRDLELVVVNKTNKTIVVVETIGEPREASMVDTLTGNGVHDIGLFDKGIFGNDEELGLVDWPTIKKTKVEAVGT
ncbi:hypothetical protein GQ457_11G025740 [Hibiscus cannabinus]